MTKLYTHPKLLLKHVNTLKINSLPISKIIINVFFICLLLHVTMATTQSVFHSHVNDRHCINVIVNQVNLAMRPIIYAGLGWAHHTP